MNKQELVDAVAASVGDRRTAATAVEAVLDTITRTVAAGERVALTGFGVFEKADRAARAARNPATGATVQVAATSVPRFRAGTGLKDVVSGRRPAPEPAPPQAEAVGGEPPARARRAPRGGSSSAGPAAAPLAEADGTAASGKGSGKDASKASGQDANKASGKAPGKGAGKAPGKGAGKAPDKGAGKASGKGAGKTTGKDSGKTTGKDSGKTAGKGKSVRASAGKTKRARSAKDS